MKVNFYEQDGRWAREEDVDVEPTVTDEQFQQAVVRHLTLAHIGSAVNHVRLAGLNAVYDNGGVILVAEIPACKCGLH